jgi:hypothetical protein
MQRIEKPGFRKLARGLHRHVQIKLCSINLRGKMMRKFLLASVATTALSGGCLPAMADSLTPAACPGGVCDGFSSTIGVGTSTSITNKVGVITAGTPTSAQADVLFISDTTGSMGSAISQVQSVFSSVVTNLAGLGNVATGAADYRDGLAANGDAGDYTYKLDAPISTTSATTQAGINTWSGSGGGDEPEQALFALTSAAANTSTGWRAGSLKIAVITGDAPSHSSPGHPSAAGGVSVASTAAALKAEGVTVESINAGNLTGDTLGLNGFGQFSGTGSIEDLGVPGTFTSALPTGSALTTLLTSLIGSAFASYSDVSLDVISTSGTGVCTISLPADQTGSFTRATTNTFDFGAVSITGVSAGTCDYTLALEANGAILAEETDAVTVGGSAAVPEPASMAILGFGLGAIGLVRRRFAKR